MRKREIIQSRQNKIRETIMIKRKSGKNAMSTGQADKMLSYKTANASYQDITGRTQQALGAELQAE